MILEIKKHLLLAFLCVFFVSVSANQPEALALITKQLGNRLASMHILAESLVTDITACEALCCKSLLGAINNPVISSAIREKNRLLELSLKKIKDKIIYIYQLITSLSEHKDNSETVWLIERLLEGLRPDVQDLLNERYKRSNN